MEGSRQVNTLFNKKLLEVINELDKKKCTIYKKQVINKEIDTFLSTQPSVCGVINDFPAIGHVLSMLQEDGEFLVQTKTGTVFIDNVLWFYRPQSGIVVEKRATHWSQSVFQSAFNACIRVNSPLFFECAWTKEKESTKLLDVQALFQRSMNYFSTCGLVLEAVCCCCTILLRHNKIAVDKVSRLIETLPLSVVDNPAVQILFKQTRNYLLNGIDIRAFNNCVECSLRNVTVTGQDSFKSCFAKKSRSYLETVLLERLKYWLLNKQILEKDFWLIKLLSEARDQFQNAIQILHAVLVLCKYSTVIELFINEFILAIRNVQKELFNLYPRRMLTIVCLLEENPAGEMIESVRCTTCSALSGELISFEEALMLATHFPKWKTVMEAVLHKEATIMKLIHKYSDMKT